MQLAGELSKINLGNILNLLQNGEVTGKLLLTQGLMTAFIFVRSGRIIHAESDNLSGTDALLELFLWLRGTFSFIETPLDGVTQSIADDVVIEKLVREGIACSTAKKYLDHKGISFRSVLCRTDQPYQGPDQDFLALIDGVSKLGDILARVSLKRYQYIRVVERLLKAKAIRLLSPDELSADIKLPDWVLSRLRQDNPDISRAIVEMVIWCDRVKCWMYQADAELAGIIDHIQPGSATMRAQNPEPLKSEEADEL